VENIASPRPVKTETLTRLRAVFQEVKASVCSLLSEGFHADPSADARVAATLSPSRRL
jgi:hypothetical protein